MQTKVCPSCPHHIKNLIGPAPVFRCHNQVDITMIEITQNAQFMIPNHSGLSTRSLCCVALHCGILSYILQALSLYLDQVFGAAYFKHLLNKFRLFLQNVVQKLRIAKKRIRMRSNVNIINLPTRFLEYCIIKLIYVVRQTNGNAANQINY